MSKPTDTNHDRTILPSEAFGEGYVPEFNTPKPEIGNMARNRLREAQADLLTKLEAEL